MQKIFVDAGSDSTAQGIQKRAIALPRAHLRARRPFPRELGCKTGNTSPRTPIRISPVPRRRLLLFRFRAGRFVCAGALWSATGQQ